MTRSSSTSRRWVLPAAVVVLWLFVGGPLGSFAGRLAGGPEERQRGLLAQERRVDPRAERLLGFTGQESPATVVSSSARRADRAGQETIAGYVGELREVDHVDAGRDRAAVVLLGPDRGPARRAGRASDGTRSRGVTDIRDVSRTRPPA